MKEGQRERRVACDYDAAEVIEKIQCELEHAGNNKTFRKVNKLYIGINKVMVEWYLKRRAVCLNHRKSNTRAPLEPIIASQVLERVQMDLVDMRSQRDADMCWICHLKCHFSKFTVLYLMSNKKASTVADCLGTYIAHVGVLDIVQCVKRLHSLLKRGTMPDSTTYDWASRWMASLSSERTNEQKKKIKRVYYFVAM